jgi:hypothetical protein
VRIATSEDLAGNKVEAAVMREIIVMTAFAATVTPHKVIMEVMSTPPLFINGT